MRRRILQLSVFGSAPAERSGDGAFAHPAQSANTQSGVTLFLPHSIYGAMDALGRLANPQFSLTPLFILNNPNGGCVNCEADVRQPRVATMASPARTELPWD
jgi:hypothetical protein